jgi:predicted pyridoxine 5'-phosphate oxidase superfamily flavin-nucleotide-binding protein
MPIVYHAGQIEVQEEANSRPAATLLAERMGSRNERNLAFYARADLVVYAAANETVGLRFGAVSGPAGLLTAIDERSLSLPGAMARMAPGTKLGAMAIDLEAGSRARFNGVIEVRGDGKVLSTREEFVNCRKYIAPSEALDRREHSGPQAREDIAANDEGLVRALGSVETAFVASVDPSGQPEVSHKGGPPGFLNYDPVAGRLEWIELIGNGCFRTAGNVRATRAITVAALDLVSGDAYQLTGRARYTTRLRYTTPRERALWPAEEDFPVQGLMTMQVEEVSLLRGLIAPRRPLKDVAKVTSCSSIEEQVSR